MAVYLKTNHGLDVDALAVDGEVSFCIDGMRVTLTARDAENISEMLRVAGSKAAAQDTRKGSESARAWWQSRGFSDACANKSPRFRRTSRGIEAEVDGFNSDDISEAVAGEAYLRGYNA